MRFRSDSSIARHAAPSIQGRVVTPMMRLQDEKQTKVLLVTLAETTPVLEAAGLQADLRRAGIEPWAWIINNSVAAAHPLSPLLRQRAHNELKEIEAVAKQHARRYAVVPLLREEPVGVAHLLEIHFRDHVEGGHGERLSCTVSRVGARAAKGSRL